MTKQIETSSLSRFLLTRALPALIVTLAIGVGVLALLVWSSQQTDRISLDRQARLVELVVSKLQTETAHDQESATVWDDSVEQARAGDRDWLNSNLGQWMHDYFGIDGAYVLDPADRPIFAFTNGAMADPAVYFDIADNVAPLVKALREKMRAGDDSQVSDTVLSPGVSDLVVVRKHPAIVSVKPIVSDTGEITQAPGSEYFHVAVRFLDGSLIDELQNDYMFADLRFSWTPSSKSAESNQPLKSAEGKTIGYLVWHPYRPGSAVMASVVPVLVAVFLLALIMIAVFLIFHRRRAEELKESEEQIRYLALHDPLTGLPNRLHFNNEVDLALSMRRVQPIALVYLDLDRFKQVNDTLGHPMGDALIREFSQRLQAIVRPGDVIARIGGDEFTIMLRGDIEEINRLCEKMVDAARRPFEIDGNTVFVGVSIGAALAPVDGVDRVTLLRKADVALYYSKTTGRGRYSFFSDDMDHTIEQRRQTEADLRLAMLGDDQLQVHYQPIRSAQSRCTIGYEALLRWKHPERGMISPELFIPVAEETGLIEALGQRVLKEACRAAVNWPAMTIAVNVSGIELNNPDYAGRVHAVLAETGLLPERLELEITETTATGETDAAVENLKSLREAGIRIAIDDFGTGFSSLSRLQSLNVNRIKIDRSFVRGLGQGGDDEAIVRAIVDLAHAKGLKTTAEGVETPLQDEGLTQIGCDDLQGFLYSRPLPRHEVDRLPPGPAIIS
ncbi:EAL domain-containing protein [Martelella alba]|uniref:EAL domain-containing protein n=1 Tax=Martelella alba TaxID=2590451 RepID=A0A506UG71_9HYPH|nr:EAL domain-containing protein [Martelella alba]TPW32165.1 EAL domain-containing protein [Martelella alba]